MQDLHTITVRITAQQRIVDKRASEMHVTIKRHADEVRKLNALLCEYRRALEDGLMGKVAT